MQPCVTFWLGGWHPTREAVSKEIQALRPQASSSWVVSVAAENRLSWDLRQRSILLPSRHQNLAVAAMAAIERLGQVSHAFNAMDGWLFLRALGGRPTLYTVTTEGTPSARDRELLARVSLFVAETRPLADALVAAGVDPVRVHVLHPGVDLRRFSPPRDPASGRFTILFASSPINASEIDGRGVRLMADAARRLPDVTFRMLWRNWGDHAAALRALNALDLPPNVVVRWGDSLDIVREYRQAHATIACFAAGVGKSAPNSVIEGLACGRPAILTDTIGLAPLVADTGSGVVTARNADGLAAGIESMRRDYGAYASRARPAAETWFDLDRFCTAYGRFYRDLAERRVPAMDELSVARAHAVR